MKKTTYLILFVLFTLTVNAQNTEKEKVKVKKDVVSINDQQCFKIFKEKGAENQTVFKITQLDGSPLFTVTEHYLKCNDTPTDGWLYVTNNDGTKAAFDNTGSSLSTLVSIVQSLSVDANLINKDGTVNNDVFQKGATEGMEHLSSLIQNGKERAASTASNKAKLNSISFRVDDKGKIIVLGSDGLLTIATIKLKEVSSQQLHLRYVTVTVVNNEGEDEVIAEGEVDIFSGGKITAGSKTLYFDKCDMKGLTGPSTECALAEHLFIAGVIGM